MQDDDLRPEFKDAMGKLRGRVFQKVKPKSLNGKMITGENFIHLC
jgi:hypothetical protein